MIKKSIGLFLVFAFLSFILAPDFVFAEPTPSQRIRDSVGWGLLIGFVVTIVVIGIISKSKQSSEKPDSQTQDSKILSLNLGEPLITKQEELVLLRW